MSVSLPLSVRPSSVCLSASNNPAPNARILINFDIWVVFRKSVEKIQVSLKSDKNNGTLHEDLCTFMIISCWILLRMRNVSDKSYRENQNTHFMFNKFSRKSCRLWDNVEKYGTARQATDDNIIRRMRFACWITKATDTHSEYVTLIAFPRQEWLRERVSIYIIVGYIACLVLSSAKCRDQISLQGVKKS
jgi:hypothetical protein